MKTTLRASCACLALLASPALAQDDDVIVVTGSPLHGSQDDLLTGASVLGGEDLQRRAAGTIGETLRTEPGISDTAFGAGASRPIIRGQSGDRVRILTNGIGSIDASSASPDHAVAVEPATAERIEVIRGTSLLRYGSSAAGGVVNVIDGRLPETAPDGIEGAVRVQGATVNDSAEVAGGLNALAGSVGGVDVVVSASGSWRDAEDYDIPGFAESARLRALEEEEAGEIGEGGHEDDEVRDSLPNSFVHTASGAGGLALIGERGRLAVSVSRLDTKYGVPGGHEHEEGEEVDAEEEGGVFIDLGQTRVDMNGALALGGFFEEATLFAGYADYRHTEFEGPNEPGTVFTNEGFEGRLELLQTQRGGWRGASGVQVLTRDFAAIGDEAFVKPTTTDQYGLYTFQEVQAGPWHLEGGARVERTEHARNQGLPGRDFTGVSGSLGAGYDVTDSFDVGLTLSRTERAPTTEELFSDGPHLATDQYQLGDEGLGLETALGVEALAHLHGGWGALTLNLFATDYDGYVYERETGDEEDGLPVYRFTGADARFLGFELFGETGLGEFGGFDLSVDGTLDYVDAELKDAPEGTSENLPRIPPLGLTAGVEAEGYGASLRVEVEHEAGQDEVASYELPTASYTLLNLYASYALTDRVSLRAALLNATDEEARTHASFLKEEVPLPGRNLRLSLSYAF
ncbi:TonB-dependent receptor [Parvularcula dongshanensis]|uniref:Iron complex outermembrane receptor protein n=1 Tax=Parvularcula dongshanensis TaxID=1173995 RepID=A0A840I1Z7_9PROT|nr:TonB-dependent receptor [Parvularcula dongshanensis]MBB4658264.1 iron complex outermembrane receptor protein [Parvularcula dongshanensis]